jgi:hypothetical protein
MSNFLNSGFTDLNCLTNIDSDEIRTNTLYVNGVQIVANSSNFSTINCQQLICQGDLSSNTIYATTSIQNVPVSKFAYLDPTSSIQNQFNNITTNYATKTQVSNNFNSFGLLMSNTYATKTQLNSYVLSTALTSTLTNYLLISSSTDFITNASLQTELSNYALVSSLSDYALLSQLSDYALLSQLSDYALLSQLSDYTLLSQLSDYALLSQLSDYALLSQLSDYALINDISNNFVRNSILNNYVLNSQLSNYCLQSNYTALKTQADGLSLLLSNTQYINGFGLNWYGSMNVFGSLIVTINGNYLNVGTLLNALPTTYATNSSVDSKVNPVKSQADANSALIATNSTAIAGLVISSASQQTQITTLFAAIGTLEAELGTAEGQITTLEAKTALQTVVNAYTQFTGGIKIMNGLVYTSIINNNGSSDFYGLMNLREGLTVTNGITSDRVTTSTELKSNGTLQVVGTTTLTTTNINGNLIINGVPDPIVITPSNLTITNGKLTVSGETPNIFNNDTIFNGNITATNLSLTNLNCNNLYFSNSLGGNSLYIGTNGGSLISPNVISIGNGYSSTVLNGFVIFNGPTFNMSSYINQI